MDYSALVSIPSALAVIYMAKLFLTARKEDREDMKEIIRANTAALNSVAGVMERCRFLGDREWRDNAIPLQNTAEK